MVPGEDEGDNDVTRHDNTNHHHNNVMISPSLSVTDVQSIIDALIPWLTCAQGLPRVIAQLLVVELIPRLLSGPPPLPSLTTDTIATIQPNNHHQRYLHNIYRYLTTNRDAMKIMPKQHQLFRSWNPQYQCSVAGLGIIGVDNMGEVMPPHILTLLADFLKAEMKERRLREKDEQEEGEDLIVKEGNGGRQKPAASLPADEGDEMPSSEVFVLQTKRVPFDELNLGIQHALVSRKQNAAGRVRQQVVICASLIDKVANLAGIARTCEIFAAECLVMSNLKVCM